MAVEAGVSASPTDAPVVDALTGARSARSVWIDVLRAVAALMVLVSHAMLFTGYYIGTGGGKLAGFGYVIRDTVLGQGGVVLFFSLSGYLIGRPFLRALLDGSPLPATRPYFTRRFARILPAYWLALVGSLLMFPVDQGHWPSLGGFLMHAFLLRNFNAGLDEYLLPVAWTLCIEVMFYIAVPVLARAIRRSHPRPIPMPSLVRAIVIAWAATGAFALALALFGGDPTGTFDSALRDNVVGRFYLFCPGLLVALWTLRRNALVLPDRVWTRPLEPSRLPVLVILLLAVAVVVARDLGNAGWEMRYEILAMAAGLVLWRVLQFRATRSRMVRGLAALGVVSYGVYLWHYIFIHALYSQGISFHPTDHTSLLGKVTSWPASLGLGLALALPCAIVSWKLVEKPLIQRAARRSAPAESAPAPLPLLREAS